jgi:hypothetical protein
VQKKIATHAKRSLRIGAVNELRWVWRGALFMKKFPAVSSQFSVEDRNFLTTENWQLTT